MILSQIASLKEIETWYSIDDVLDANLALDLKYEHEKKAHEKIKAKR